MRGVEVVFHQAALASVPRSVADPLATHQACVNGTLHVLLAARDARGAASGLRRQLQRLRQLRTAAQDARADPTNPLSPYAVAKLAGEHYCAAFSECLRSGNGAAALLQRLRPAAAAGQPLCRGHSAVHREMLTGGRVR